MPIFLAIIIIIFRLKGKKDIRGQILVMRGHMVKNKKERFSHMGTQLSFDNHHAYVPNQVLRSSEVNEGQPVVSHLTIHQNLIFHQSVPLTLSLNQSRWIMYQKRKLLGFLLIMICIKKKSKAYNLVSKGRTAEDHWTNTDTKKEKGKN